MKHLLNIKYSEERNNLVAQIFDDESNTLNFVIVKNTNYEPGMTADEKKV